MASWASLEVPLAGPNHGLPPTTALWHTWTLPSGSFPHLRAQVLHVGGVSGLELRTVKPDSPAAQLQTPTAPTGHPDHSSFHQDLQLEQRQHPAHHHIHGNMRSREGGGVGDGHIVGYNSLLLTLGSQFYFPLMAKGHWVDMGLKASFHWGVSQRQAMRKHPTHTVQQDGEWAESFAPAHAHATSPSVTLDGITLELLP